MEGRISLAHRANGGMGTIGNTKCVSGLHDESLSVIGEGGPCQRQGCFLFLFYAQSIHHPHYLRNRTRL